MWVQEFHICLEGNRNHSRTSGGEEWQISDLQFRKVMLTVFCISGTFSTLWTPCPQIYLTLLTKYKPPGKGVKRMGPESASSGIVSIKSATESLNMDFNGSSTLIQSHSSTTWDFIISSHLSESEAAELSASNPCKQNRSFILCSRDTDSDTVRTSLQEKWILWDRVKDVSIMCCLFIMLQRGGRIL